MYDIVIVDDEQAAIRSLKAIISSCASDFCVVGEAESGAHALSVIDKVKPDLVFTDIRMPGIDGLELIERVQAMHRDIEFVVISGYDDFDYARRALRLGVVDYLLKPIVPVDVRTALAALAKRRLDDRTKPADQGPADFHSRITKAIEYIEREYAGDALSIQQVADYVRLSPSHFSRCFREETGTTYRRFLNSLRMERAASLLADPSQRISEIACRCGYRGYVPFSKAFKRFHDCSPTEYRRNRRLL